MTILWKYQMKNPMFIPIFIISHIKKASISRPIKFYMCSHKNRCKHRIFHPILSQNCYQTIITILWKFWNENLIFTPIFMIEHIKFYSHDIDALFTLVLLLQSNYIAVWSQNFCRKFVWLYTNCLQNFSFEIYRQKKIEN